MEEGKTKQDPLKPQGEDLALELLKVCPECGEEDYLLFVEDGSYFCGKCGKTVLPPDKERAKLFGKP